MVPLFDSLGGSIEKVDVQQLFYRLYSGSDASQRDKNRDHRRDPHEWKLEDMLQSQRIKSSFTTPQGGRIDVVEENIRICVARTICRESSTAYEMVEAGRDFRGWKLVSISRRQRIKSSFTTLQGGSMDVVEEKIKVCATRTIHRESPAEYKLIEVKEADITVGQNNER